MVTTCILIGYIRALTDATVGLWISVINYGGLDWIGGVYRATNNTQAEANQYQNGRPICNVARRLWRGNWPLSIVLVG